MNIENPTEDDALEALAVVLRWLRRKDHDAVFKRRTIPAVALISEAVGMIHQAQHGGIATVGDAPPEEAGCPECRFHVKNKMDEIPTPEEFSYSCPKCDHHWFVQLVAHGTQTQQKEMVN